MRSTCIEIKEAEQAKIYNYKNTGLKLRKMNAAIRLSKICKNQANGAKIFQHQNQWK